MCLYLLMVLVSECHKRKKCIKNYPCKALRISPDLFGMKKSFKSFSFVCTNDYQELLSVQIKQKYLKRNHIICVSGIQDMLSCLQWYKKFHTKNKTNRNLLPNCRSIFWSAEMLLARGVNNMIETMISWKYFKWFLESKIFRNQLDSPLYEL